MNLKKQYLYSSVKAFLFCLALLILSFTTDACVLGNSHNCETDRDCDNQATCLNKWCVPAWYNCKDSDAKVSDEQKTCTDQCKLGSKKTCYTGKSGCKDVSKQECEGNCKTGQQYCILDPNGCGKWTAQCYDQVIPASEKCNNKDDNCNGQIDESVNQGCEKQGGSKCFDGTQTCSQGKWQACQ